MKIVLEYRKQGSHWGSLSKELYISYSSEQFTDNVFGYSVWKGADDESDESFKQYPSPYTLDAQECPYTISRATLESLFKFTNDPEYENFVETRDRTANVPVSTRTLKVDLSDVALLTVEEYESCLQVLTNVVEYQAILAAAKSIQAVNYDVRLFIFRWIWYGI